MKTTDFAMIFVAILIPIIIVVYVDISFLLKKEEQTLYYKNIIDSAINDATYAMKNVEGEDQDVDYGYSGLAEKRVAVNAKIAVDAFYKSLYDNFEISGDELSEEYIKSHVPALAIVDYNGIYMYSIDEYTSQAGEASIGHVLKPKRYFTYTYALVGTSTIKSQEDLEQEINGMSNPTYTYKTVIFTMDDYIGVVDDNFVIDWFYIEDKDNNYKLYSSTQTSNLSLEEKVVQHLKLKRSEVISNIVSEEMSFAVNNHNEYAQADYSFYFPQISVNDWEEMVGNIGIVAFVQGINLGNVKLDYVAHGISGLELTTRYYVSIETSGVSSLDYYHKTSDCLIYLDSNKSFTGYYMNKTDASSNGYYACPICNP